MEGICGYGRTVTTSEQKLLEHLNSTSKQEEASKAITSSLSAREDELLKLYSQGEIEDVNERNAWYKSNGLTRFITKDANGNETSIKISNATGDSQIKYNRANIAYQGFQTLLKNFFETMQRGIQNLRVN